MRLEESPIVDACRKDHSSDVRAALLSPYSRMKLRLLPATLVLLASFVVVLAGRPALAQPRLDAIQLLEDVQALAADSMQGRAAGSPGGARARHYIQQQFEAIGLRAFAFRYAQPFVVVRSDTIQAANVVGYLPGTAHPDVFFVLTAHYDHLGVRRGTVFNGADDNASGVAGLLALARYFSLYPPKHSLVFAALDAEEIGLQGAEAFLKTPPVPKAQIRLNVNLDMISRNADDELFAAGTAHEPALKPLLEKAAARSKIRLLFGHDGSGRGSDWTMSSDHGPFHRAGIPFVYFGVEDHPDYHRSTDTYERIDPAFFLRAVDTIVDAVAILDEHFRAHEPASH